MKTISFFKHLLFAIIFTTAITSCKKNALVLTASALVIDSGDPASDGCGWLIKINGTDSTYSPKNLPDAYKSNNLKVNIAYIKATTKFGCGWLPGTGPTQIQLTEIVKQ